MEPNATQLIFRYKYNFLFEIFFIVFISYKFVCYRGKCVSAASVPGYYSNTLNACSPNPCQNGGVCINNKVSLSNNAANENAPQFYCQCPINGETYIGIIIN